MVAIWNSREQGLGAHIWNPSTRQGEKEWDSIPKSNQTKPNEQTKETLMKNLIFVARTHP